MSDLWPRTFEDFAVGDRMTAGPLSVGADEIEDFCRRYDPQSVHLDPSAADASILNGMAGSGWHTAALTMRMIVDGKMLGGSPIIGRGLQKLLWPNPMRPGDTLRVEAEIIETIPSRSGAPRGTLIINIRTFNQHNDIVVEFEPILMLPTRAA